MSCPGSDAQVVFAEGMRRWHYYFCIAIAGATLSAGFTSCGSSDDSAAKELAREKELDNARAQAKREATDEGLLSCLLERCDDGVHRKYRRQDLLLI